ncbi:MAG: Peptide deformylase [Parcubacteria group bacterium]|nr:Peptide deformylase [Parcubacteria group bacterium]
MNRIGAKNMLSSLPNSMGASQPKFAFFGTPYVARDTLAYLVEHGFVPAVVITSPDAASGRGMQLAPTEVKEWALAHELPVLTPEKITPDFVQSLAAYGMEYAIVVAYGKILPQSLINAFPKGILNIHYSLLPKYRGASPVESALLQGDTVTGVAIQRMVYELDAGDILALREVPIEPLETTRELRPRLITLGAELLAEVLPSFIDGSATFTPQDVSQVTKCGKIDKKDGELDLAGDARTNWNKYRAYAESPGTYFYMERNGKRIRVKIKTASFDGTVFMPLRVVPEGKNETDYEILTRS